MTTGKFVEILKNEQLFVKVGFTRKVFKKLLVLFSEEEGNNEAIDSDACAVVLRLGGQLLLLAASHRENRGEPFADELIDRWESLDFSRKELDKARDADFRVMGQNDELVAKAMEGALKMLMQEEQTEGTRT